MLIEEGIDLKNKKISDAPYPLFICSSNLTRKTITVFKGDIPILDAISASACIPLIFYPKVINNCAYIDGGYLTNTMMNFIPHLIEIIRCHFQLSMKTLSLVLQRFVRCLQFHIYIRYTQFHVFTNAK